MPKELLTALPHLAFLGVVVVVYLATRETVRHLRGTGARALTPRIVDRSPLILFAVAEAGYLIPELRLITVAAIVLICAGLATAGLAPDLAIRALGGRHPLAELGIAVMRIERLALLAERAPGDERLLAEVERELEALARFRSIPDAPAYLDDFSAIVRQYVSGGPMSAYVPLLERNEIQEAKFHEELVRLGVKGPLARWGSSPAASAAAHVTLSDAD